jgi:hypothetical protein
VRLGVPAYFLPGADWASLHSPAVGHAILNPETGPGPHAGYAAAVAAAQRAGVKVLGYVDTLRLSPILKHVSLDAYRVSC